MQCVQFVKFLLVSPGGYAYKTTLLAIAPYYEYNPNSSGTASPSMLQEIESLSAVSGTYVMDYRQSQSAQTDFIRARRARRCANHFDGGSTTNANAKPGISYHGTPAPHRRHAQLRELVKPRNSGLIGRFDNVWNSEDSSLQTVLPPP